MAINDGHMTDHMPAFGLPISGLRGAFSAAVGDPSVRTPKGGGGLGGLNPPIKVPTIPGSFGRPRGGKPKKYSA